jgi:hypothetical protein
MIMPMTLAQSPMMIGKKKKKKGSGIEQIHLLRWLLAAPDDNGDGFCTLEALPRREVAVELLLIRHDLVG